MTNKYRKQVAQALIILFFLTSCQQKKFDAQLSSAPEGEPITGEPTTGEEAGRPNEACYPNYCFTTTPKSSISPDETDYRYPNPDDFPRESMRRYYQAPSQLIDLKNLNPKMALTKNFMLQDFMLEAKGQYGLFSPTVTSRLQNLRSQIGRPIIINSGYRSPGYNSKISGSADWSRHTYGDAVDFYIPGQSIESLVALCKAMGVSFSLTYEAHIHCDWRLINPAPPFYSSPSPSPIDEEAFNREKITKHFQDSASIGFYPQNNKLTMAPLLGLLEEEASEGELTYAWTITDANGHKTQSRDKSVTIERTGGSVSVEVLIGGSIQLESQIEW